MAQMQISGRGVRDSIRRLLGESYRGSTILKELVQNADDAGATRLRVVVLDEGAAGTDHPLLGGPALLAVNNGGMRAADAVGIRSLGDSGKEAEAGTIGRFGLGMKSVFHLCDAFLWMASPAPDAAAAAARPRREMVNPWDGVALYRDWTEPSDEQWDTACNAAREASPEILTDKRWFCLWIPLRTPQLIAGNRQGFGKASQTDPLVSLLDPASGRRLALALPLLRHLREIEVEGRGQRYRLGCRDQPSDAGAGEARPIRATVIHEAEAEPEEAPAIGSRGSNAGLAEELRRDKDWPVREDRDSGQMVPAEAEAQGAAFFIGRPATSPAATTLDIQPAVFLPLTDPDVGPAFDVSLVLHGEFFVDSGRHAIRLETTAERTGLEARWNHALLDRVVLPRVPAALLAFAEAATSPDERNGFIGRLVEQIDGFVRGPATPDIHLRGRQASLCRDRQLVPRLAPAGVVWELIGPDEAVHEIACGPAAAEGPTAAHALIQRALPGFSAASGEAVLVSRGTACLTAAQPAPPHAKLAEALLGDPAELARRFDADHARIIVPLLKQLESEGKLSRVRTLLAARVSKPGAAREALSKVADLLPRDLRLAVPDGLPATLLGCPFPLLLVPRCLKEAASTATGKLDAASAESILHGARTADLPLSTLSKLAKAVFAAVERPTAEDPPTASPS